MIEHIMDVSDAELRVAIAALGPFTVYHEADLLKEGWFRPRAVAKVRRSDMQNAENFCAAQARNGKWEKRRALLTAGGSGMFYREKKVESKGGAKKK